MNNKTLYRLQYYTHTHLILMSIEWDLAPEDDDAIMLLRGRDDKLRVVDDLRWASLLTALRDCRPICEDSFIAPLLWNGIRTIFIYLYKVLKHLICNTPISLPISKLIVVVYLSVICIGSMYRQLTTPWVVIRLNKSEISKNSLKVFFE